MNEKIQGEAARQALEEFLQRMRERAAEMNNQPPQHPSSQSQQAVSDAKPPPTETFDELDAQPGPDDQRCSHQQEGRYLIFNEIGRGGMGAVLRGHDPDIGRDVAIKIIHPERLSQLDDSRRSEMLHRFYQEAKVTGQLQHPGIVPIYEVGQFPALQDESTRPYFAMKLVKGSTLAKLLQKRSNPIEDLPRFLKIFEQVCQTLAYAHSRRVIHRDLKPLNIMIGAFGEVQVMDWGLAKVLEKESSTSPGKGVPHQPHPATNIQVDPFDRTGVATRAGWGTLEYMAPEQARGEVEHLDERCDVFALGGVLCKILTGQATFVGETEKDLKSTFAQHAI